MRDRRRSGGVAVFVDQSAEHVDPFDAPDIVDAGGCRLRRRDGHVEVDAAVRPSGVVVPDVLSQDLFEVAAVPDEYPVEAFGPYGAYPPLRVGVGPRSQLHRMRMIGSDGCG